MGGLASLREPQGRSSCSAASAVERSDLRCLRFQQQILKIEAEVGGR